MLTLYNSLSRKKEEFVPLAKEVKFYSCGPTVYHYAHIGNLRNLIFNDTLRRTMEVSDWEHSVRHVMNITDVGHLTSDADEGEDKLEKGAREAGKDVWEVAKFYTDAFQKNCQQLNILPPTELVKATDEIPTQIDLVQTLLDKDFAYTTEQAIYFDISKLDDYGKLSGQKLSDKEVGARSDVVTDTAKRNPHDFAVWFFTVGHFADHTMRWEAPFGEGFPGWHLECSAIIHAHLGETIDLHTGGVDHIGTHHTNEIAQSEAAFGKPLANFWVHNEFLLVDGAKMAKSLRNTYTLDDLTEKDYHPLAFRLLILSSHYRSQQNFTFAALRAATNSLLNLYAWSDLQFQNFSSDRLSNNYAEAMKAISNALADDLNTPEAIGFFNGMVKRVEELGYDSETIALHSTKLEKIFGLGLDQRQDITDAQKELIRKRDSAKQQEDFVEADRLRKELTKVGLELNDTPQGTRWRRTNF